MAFALPSMLNTARDNNIRSIALPAIGTGVFKFPSILAARITAQTLVQYARKGNTGVDLVRICVPKEELRDVNQSALDQEMASIQA